MPLKQTENQNGNTRALDELQKSKNKDGESKNQNVQILSITGYSKFGKREQQMGCYKTNTHFLDT